MKLGEAWHTMHFRKKDVTKNQLYTPWGEALVRRLHNKRDGQEKSSEADEVGTAWESSVLSEYPRPQMRRNNMRSLNGWWKYAITDWDSEEPGAWEGRILVPFSPESALSEVGRQLLPKESLWYEREILLSKEELMRKEDGRFVCGRLLLHFGAVDQACQVWWNGKRLGGHQGGYLPFTFEVTELIEPVNVLRVQVWDQSDTSYHTRGKQTLHPEGMFYTAQSGIWQTVWMEWVPEEFIESIRLTPDFERHMVRAELTLRAVPEDPAVPEEYGVVRGKRKRLLRERFLSETEFHPWTPEDPYLYDWKLSAGEDTIETYFAMRCFTIETDEAGIPRLCLNHKPYYQHGVLDQGYWPDGLMTPPSDEAYIYDIQSMKQAGFNMIRKHIKVESLRWYYHCDRLGMLVWQDMVNGGSSYHPMTVTYLPTVFPYIQSHMKDSRCQLFSRVEKKGRQEWLAECRETIKHLYNCPCIGMWVPFNEGWGQFDALRVAKMVRNIDGTRWIDHASGWVDQGGGDVKSIHNYFRKLEVKPDKQFGRPVVYSEYGGYAWYVAGHSYSNQIYGYRHYQRAKELQEAYQKLQRRIEEMKADGLCADVYTQVSDVEDEVNGLLTYDRKVKKLQAVDGVGKTEEKK